VQLNAEVSNVVARTTTTAMAHAISLAATAILYRTQLHNTRLAIIRSVA
jgi:hypothetical protein